MDGDESPNRNTFLHTGIYFFSFRTSQLFQIIARASPVPSLNQKIDNIKMAAEIRLTKELKEVSKDDKTSGVKAVALEGGNNRLLLGTLSGPSGTPYEGGTFEVDISIPKQYPFEPPKMVSFTLIISWDKRRIIRDLLSSSRSFCRDGISNIKIMFMYIYIFIISRFELPYIMFVLSHMFICNSPQSQSYTEPFIKSNQIKSNQFPEIYYKNMAPEYLIPNGRNLPRHPQRPMVACAHHQDRPTFPPGPPLLP